MNLRPLQGLTVDEAKKMVALLNLIRANKLDGVTSSEITRLHGQNLRPLLLKLEDLELLFRVPTGRRDKGLRWVAISDPLRDEREKPLQLIAGGGVCSCPTCGRSMKGLVCHE